MAFKKLILPFTLLLGVLLLDQGLKFWVKAHMDYPFNQRNLPYEIPIWGDWFKLHFVENDGMAFGIRPGGDDGKIWLTLFRIVLAAGGLFYLFNLIKKNAHLMLIACVAVIIAGALGNIIDSVFYGVWYKDINAYQGGFFYGQVVDMLYFPLWDGIFPQWLPFWGGEHFLFFSPVFNLADSAISVGLFSIILFQNWLFNQDQKDANQENTPLSEENNPLASTTEGSPENV